MNFLKKLFLNNKVNDVEKVSKKTEISDIAIIEPFDIRYKKDIIDDTLLNSALKIIESYFIDNKIERKVKSPINHPLNLDQTIDDGFGISRYCKAFNLTENHALMFLALTFNDFMIKEYNFKLFEDSKPEFPLRTMTLKHDNDGARLSLYPIEYTSRVLKQETSFEYLHNRVKTSL